MNLNKKIHFPVLLHKVVEEARDIQGKGVFIDCTMGDGGHSHEIFTQVISDKKQSYLLSLDWDQKSFDFVSSFFEEKPLQLDLFRKENKNRWLFEKTNFALFPKIMEKMQKKVGQLPLKFLLMDLGISSRQYAEKERGFSFESESVLDMRMDPETYTITAYQLLNLLSIAKMTNMFIKTVGMKKMIARKLAQEIVLEREKKLFGHRDDVRRVNEIASKVQTLRINSIGKLHPATLIFLALRIAVNTELQNLYETLLSVSTYLDENGKILVITYHSQEEKIVDEFVKHSHLSAKKFHPSKNEIFHNSRARSAILHIIS